MTEVLTTDVAPDWEGRQRIAADRLDELRRERGVAKLEGKAFDSRQIVEAEAELDAIAAAQVEAERRRREEQEVAVQARRAELRAHLTETLDARSKAITEAELAVYKLASALEQLLATSKDVSRTMRALGHPAPSSVDETTIKLRASLRIAAILGPVCGNSFGRISFPVARGPHLADGTSILHSWLESDALKIASDISKVHSGEQP
jgi:hypothetical protein